MTWSKGQRYCRPLEDGRLYLGRCDACVRALYAPAAVVDGPKARLVVHPACRDLGRAIVSKDSK